MASSASVATGQATLAPTRKIVASTIAGAVTSILVYFLNKYITTGQNNIPPEIAAAMTTLISAVIGWIVPPSPNETVV